MLETRPCSMRGGRCDLLVRMILLMLALLPSPAGATGKRVALVIGNGAYRHLSPLRNPANDARAVAAKLRGLRFDVVIEKTNLSRADMGEAAAEFFRASQQAEVALLYYVGHGRTDTRGTYLFPVDARLPKDEFDIPGVSIRLVSPPA